MAAPCLVEAAVPGPPPGAPVPPVRELRAAEFTDGPWCGGGLPFDVDLFRIRRVRIAIRFRVADDAWRGGDFLSPDPPDRMGRSGGVPDLTIRFDVAPRSLSSW